MHQLLIYLGAMLTVAKEWGIIQQSPIKIRKIKEPAPKVRFYDFSDFDRLVVQAEVLGKANHLLTVLLGGSRSSVWGNDRPPMERHRLRGRDHHHRAGDLARS